MKSFLSMLVSTLLCLLHIAGAKELQLLLKNHDDALQHRQLEQHQNNYLRRATQEKTLTSLLLSNISRNLQMEKKGGRKKDGMKTNGKEPKGKDPPVVPPVAPTVTPPVAPPLATKGGRKKGGMKNQRREPKDKDPLIASPVASPVTSPVAPPIAFSSPMAPPVAPPVEPPVDPPVTSPMDPPVSTPVAPPVEPPVDPPATSPMDPPVTTPVAPPVEPPVDPPVTPPVDSPVELPVDPPVTPPVDPPVEPPVDPPVEPPVDPPVTPPVTPPVAPLNNVVARINCGSFQFSQIDGTVWSTDTSEFHTLAGTNNYTDNDLTITGTNLPAGIEPLLKSDLYGSEFEYFFDVSSYPDGSLFDVTLWMAEIFFDKAGQRVFSVFAESKTSDALLKDLDLISDIGGKNIAKKYDFKIAVNDGQLNLFFVASTNNAKVSGIEVLYDASSAPKLPPPVDPPVTLPVPSVPPSSIPGCRGLVASPFDFKLVGAQPFTETLSFEEWAKIVSETGLFLMTSIDFPANSYKLEYVETTTASWTLEADGSILIAGIMAGVSAKCGADSPPIDPFFVNALESEAFLQSLRPDLVGTPAENTTSISLVITPFPFGWGRLR